jgi:hypothetical protein
VLIGCFDESRSSREGGFVSIAGFVATEERWAAFDAAWNAALAKHRVPYLHTTDLANFKRIYKGWTADQQRALVADLMIAIWGMGRVVAIGSTMRSMISTRSAPSSERSGSTRISCSSRKSCMEQLWRLGRTMNECGLSTAGRMNSGESFRASIGSFSVGIRDWRL